MRVYDDNLTCNRIFDLAKEEGLSDYRLAKTLEMTPQAISKWRRGVGAPSLDVLVMMADLFQVSLDDLIMTQEIDMEFCSLE